MNSTDTFELQLFPPPPKSKVRAMHGIDLAIRVGRRRHRKLGLPVYHPRECRRQILALLADGEWHKGMRIYWEIGMGAHGVHRVLDMLVFHGRIERREHYIGADPMFPTVRPATYQGFGYAYRLKQPPSP